MGQKPSEIRLHDWKRFSLLLIALAALLAAGLLLNLNIGSVRIHPDRIVQMLFRGMEDSTESRILFSIRIPRMLLAAILGGALSVSGFLLQTFFRNPIAGPLCWVFPAAPSWWWA